MPEAAIMDSGIGGAAAPEGIAQWLPFAVLLLDADDRVTFANPAAERFFRQSSHFLQRRSLQEVAGPALPARIRLASPSKPGTPSPGSGWKAPNRVNPEAFRTVSMVARSMPVYGPMRQGDQYKYLRGSLFFNISLEPAAFGHTDFF